MSALQDFLFGGTPFTDAQIELAQSNYRSRVELLEQLQVAFEESGLFTDDLTRELGWDAETVDRVLAGARDITLTDLAQLATAMNAAISFRVAPKVASQSKVLRGVPFSDNVWFLSTEWRQDSLDSDRALA